MTRTTTQIGRAQLQHPDLAFDTDDGGTALHDALATMWSSVSNHLPSRWTGSITLGASATTTVTHYFNMPLSGLKVMIFESGIQLTPTEVATYYSITQATINSISIQNISGGSRTFDALLLAFSFLLTSSELEPGVIPNSNWDKINGTDWNQSLYKNGSYTVSTPQEYENVIILGNLTLNANLTVRGRLVVVGNVTGVGYKFDCDGDVSIIGNVSITGISAPTMTIGGNLKNFTTSYFVFNGNSGTQGTFTCKGDVTIVNSSDGSSASLITGNLTNTAGNNVVIYGNARCSIITNALGNLGTVGLDGGFIKIYGNIITGIGTSPGLDTSGSSGISGNAGGNAGYITVAGDIIGTAIKATGASAISSTGGNGGNLNVEGNLKADYNVDLRGGSVSTSGTGGNGGYFNISGDAHIRDSAVLYTNGGDVPLNASSIGGNTGYVTCLGTLTVGSIYANGSSQGNSARNGGTIIIGNLLLQSNLNAYGGTNNGGFGGSITIKGSARCSGEFGTILNYGGSVNSQTNSNNGGSGGAVLINGDCNQIAIKSYGGICLNGVNAGSGGNITIHGKITGNGTLNQQNYWSYGADFTGGSGTGFPGNGGNIIVGSCDSSGSAFKLDGGRNNIGGDSFAGGNSGLLIINGNANCGIISTIGGNVTKSSGTGTGGIGGNILITGDAVISSITTDGGNVNTTGGGNGGNSGYINVKGNLTIIGAGIVSNGGSGGGNSTAGGNAGTSSGCVVIGGNLIQDALSNSSSNFTISSGTCLRDKSGTASGGLIRAIIIGGNWIWPGDGYISIVAGNAIGTNVTDGNGGNGKGNYTSSPQIIVQGNITWGNNTTNQIVYILGGDGKTKGGHSSGVRCEGFFACHGPLYIGGGTAINGTGKAGGWGPIQLGGGGNIPSILVLGSGAAESTGIVNCKFGGITTIGKWDIDGTIYPSTVYKAKTYNVDGSAFVIIRKKVVSTSSCFNTDGVDGFPNAAVVFGNDVPEGPMMGSGFISDGTTQWMWSGFYNT